MSQSDPGHRAPDAGAQPRHQEPRSKAYPSESNGITVFWEPRLCIHTGKCFQNLGAVFQPWDRPWVKPDRSSPERVAEVVRMCPSGALRFETPAGPESPETPGALEVTVVPDGPLYLRGDFEIVEPDGAVVRRATRAALCRCGQSGNKPFCDNTHLDVRFRAD